MMMLMGYLAIFALCLWVPTLSRGWIWLVALGVALVFSAFLFLRERRSLGKKKVAVLCAVMIALTLAASLLSARFAWRTLFPMEELGDSKAHTLEGYVEDILYEEPFGASYHVVLTSVDGEPVEGGITLSVDDPAGLSVEDEMSCTAGTKTRLVSGEMREIPP